MKAKVIFLTVILTISVTSLNAKIWRVNSTRPADFSTAQAAHDGANPGDTLYFEPSSVAYGNLTLTKKLIMIGTGYFLTENPETQWIKTIPATMGAVTFSKTGSQTSEHSQLMGMTVTGNVTVNVSNITIRRNYIGGTTYFSQVSDTIEFINFRENYCTWELRLTGYIHDVNICNNLFLLTYYNSSLYITGSVNYNGLFMNNVFVGSPSAVWGESLETLSLSNFSIQNNILTGKVLFVPGISLYTNNISDNTAFGTSNNNQSNVPASALFTLTGSSDAKYQLKTGSPAIGAGTGGIDCGVFGGQSPYVLSGMPAIPAIYQMVIGNNTNNQTVVDVKIKSHN